MNFIEFVTESNRIEGIHRPPTDEEVSATRDFICGAQPTLESVRALASVYTSGEGLLRERDDMNVRVGSHVAPTGGPAIRVKLQNLLNLLDILAPYGFHLEYENLHPFLDGNGRTGRALWAWQMVHSNDPYLYSLLKLGFLHAWYYQTFAASRS